MKDEDAHDRYERLAKEFYETHGMLAPGKDEPPGVMTNYDIRWQAWQEFLKAKRECGEPMKYDKMNQEDSKLSLAVAVDLLRQGYRDGCFAGSLKEQVTSFLRGQNTDDI